MSLVYVFLSGCVFDYLCLPGVQLLSNLPVCGILFVLTYILSFTEVIAFRMSCIQLQYIHVLIVLLNFLFWVFHVLSGNAFLLIFLSKMFFHLISPMFR